MTDAGPVTRLDWVEGRLRARIASGELRSGDRVLVTDLAQEWKVSATPVREAVQRLAAAGLLTANPQRGARIAAISASEALELYELRALLEPMALAASMQNADDDYRAAVRAALECLNALRRRRGRVEAMERFLLHREFHDSTLSRCPSTWLLRLTDVLMDQALRYVPYTRYRGEDRLDEHTLLNEHIQTGNIDAAVDFLRSHLESSADHLAVQLADLDQPLADTSDRGARP